MYGAGRLVRVDDGRPKADTDRLADDLIVAEANNLSECELEHSFGGHGQ